jgi:hypothetical protein
LIWQNEATVRQNKPRHSLFRETNPIWRLTKSLAGLAWSNDINSLPGQFLRLNFRLGEARPSAARSVISITPIVARPRQVKGGGTFQGCVRGPMKWPMRNHTRLSRAMSRLRGSLENRRVLDELEWHRWFAWYPVVVSRDHELAYWTWLQFVERKTHWSRSMGQWILRYRSA